MAYNTGNFYTDSSNNHILDNYNIENAVITGAEITDATIGGVEILSGGAVPTASVLGEVGALYVCTLSGSIGLYINTGTATAPVWGAVTLQS